MYYYMDMPFSTEQEAKQKLGSICMYFKGKPPLGYIDGTNVAYREYSLLSTDISKLDNITNAIDGSKAFAIDTGKIYILCSNQWREWTGGVSSDIKWSHY